MSKAHLWGSQLRNWSINLIMETTRWISQIMITRCKLHIQKTLHNRCSKIRTLRFRLFRVRTSKTRPPKIRSCRIRWMIRYQSKALWMKSMKSKMMRPSIYADNWSDYKKIWLIIQRLWRSTKLKNSTHLVI